MPPPGLLAQGSVGGAEAKAMIAEYEARISNLTAELKAERDQGTHAGVEPGTALAIAKSD